MNLKKGLLAVFLAALTALSGCSLTETVDLYSLPQPSKEYLQLQTLINAEIAAGCEYAAPTAGSQRQSVQLTDLDGDGTNEAVAFLRNKDLQPLICVYRKTDGKYALTERITGDGSAVGRVEYADLDGDGNCEIVASWEAASDMQLMAAYSLAGGTSTVLFKASCLDFQIGDIDRDGRSDVTALSFDQSGGRVTLFSLTKRRDVAQRSAKLSASLKTVSRFRVASIAGGVPAIFVEGSYDEDAADCLLTDIVVWGGNELQNITLDPASGDSRTKRRGGAFCTDIDGDGALDVPIPEPRQSGIREAPENAVYDWYTYGADGQSSLRAATYHCYTDGWYLTLPDSWRNRLVVRRGGAVAGEQAVVLSVKDDRGALSDQLTVYTLTDENRTDRSRLGERFVLTDSGTVVYAAEIDAADGFPGTADVRAEVRQRFHLITTEWITGAL